MSGLPEHIYTVDIVRGIDRCAIETHGIPGYTLMTRAGEAALDLAELRYAGSSRWLFLAGPGNNAGDAYVMARLAADAGLQVTLLALADPGSLAGDAKTAADDFLAAGGKAEPFKGELPADVELIVDGLFGSGLMREVGGAYAEAIKLANAHPAPVFALDIPSGIAGDTGQALGTAFAADATIAFVGLKLGYFLGDGIDATGHLGFAGLKVPAECYPVAQAAMRQVPDSLLEGFRRHRRANAHKGDFGHVLVAGGAEGMPGAALMAGMAALRTGAGRVTVATHPAHASDLVARCPELMVRGIEEPADLEPLLARTDVIALGPGLGSDAWSRWMFDVVSTMPQPAVWDAGALPLLAEVPTRAVDRILTPHPGEAGVLLGRGAAEVQADRLDALSALRERYDGIAVLKGARSLVSGAAGCPFVCLRGNPGMASAGMGDVLTGVIAALRAQGLDTADAALLGVDVHARAGDLAAATGERGLIASDVIASLRTVVNP